MCSMETDNRSQSVTQRLRALAGAAEAGARLPSVRDLMREWHVSPVTVQRALDTLAREGVLEARPGRGTFVSARVTSLVAPADFGWQSLVLGPARDMTNGLGTSMIAPPIEARQLQVGYLPAALQPGALLSAATSRALRRPGVWDRVPSQGMEALRSWFASGTEGAFTAREVMICPGSQAAIAAVFRALATPGEPVLMESPTYYGAIASARAAGLRPVPVPTDEQGVRPDLLDEAFERSGAKLFYCQPTFANPTGTVLPPERRAAVLAIAAARNAFVVEDDWARDFFLEAEHALAPMAAGDVDGHVVYLRSLTKCAAPGLRIGALCARGPALERLRATRLVDDFFVSGLLQETALQLVTSAAWPRHLRVLRTALRRNRDLLAAALVKHLGQDAVAVPRGGLHLWLRLPDDCPDLEAAQRLAACGVLAVPGCNAFPAEPSGNYLRLSFANIEAEWVAEAAAAVAGVMRD